MLNNRLLRRTAHSSSRGGFTLVELLVVIGIIAILAGVALGPITNGIKKAKQSAGLQSAHALGIAMYSCANDNNQVYPDSSAGTADNIAGTLMAGGYVSDATIFHISSDTGTGSIPITSANNTATTIVSTPGGTSWDFMGNAGNGVSSTQYTFCPILWSTLAPSGAPTTFAVTAGSPIVATPVITNPFGTDGAAIFYINNSAAFVTSTVATGIQLNMVSGANNLGGIPGTYAPLYGH